MTPEQEQPYAVGLVLHIFYSLKAAPKMIFETIVAIVTAAVSDADVFLIVAGTILLSLVLPWQLVFGGALVFYAVLRTVNAWINNVAGAQRDNLNMIGQVLDAEKRVAIVQVPEVLTRSVEVDTSTKRIPGALGVDEELSWEGGDTGDEDGN